MRRMKTRGNCKALRCGRSARSGGYCHAHFKDQAEAIEAPRSVIPHPSPLPGKVQFAGLTLDSETAEAIARMATDLGIAPRALIADLVEDWAWHEEWARRERTSRAPRPPESPRPHRRGR